MSYPFRGALLDTSVAVEWFVTEEDSERAADLRQAHLRDDLQLHTPDILLMESANALRYAGLSEERILQDLETFSALDVEIVPFGVDVLSSAVSLAPEHDLAVYVPTSWPSTRRWGCRPSPQTARCSPDSRPGTCAGPQGPMTPYPRGCGFGWDVATSHGARTMPPARMSSLTARPARSVVPSRP